MPWAFSMRDKPGKRNHTHSTFFPSVHKIIHSYTVLWISIYRHNSEAQLIVHRSYLISSSMSVQSLHQRAQAWTMFDEDVCFSSPRADVRLWPFSFLLMLTVLEDRLEWFCFGWCNMSTKYNRFDWCIRRRVWWSSLDSNTEFDRRRTVSLPWSSRRGLGGQRCICNWSYQTYHRRIVMRREEQWEQAWSSTADQPL